MLVYILKSAGCLAILFLFYKLFLEKENMHVFKRFYLLASLVFSLVIPTIVFTEYKEVPAITTQEFSQYVPDSNEVIDVPPALERDITDFAPLLWIIYFLGLFFFGVKFIKNLVQIFRRIRRNPKQKLPPFTRVLLQEKLPPHTFFKYIFLNKKKLASNEIPKEVLLHEETHAQQKHSRDVVFVELLQVVFWLNPFVYLFKKAIKLNHEFLADQAVLQNNIDQSTYQNTLLSYSSPDSQKKYQPIGMANAINYSSIKKRFTVMKKNTSKKGVLIRSLLLLPLLAILLYSFTETKLIIKEEAVINNSEGLLPETVSSKQNSDIERISNRSVELAGLILDSKTLQPIENVEIYDANGTKISKTDHRGYYKVQFDKFGQGEMIFKFSLRKDGYKPLAQREHWGDLQGKIESTIYFGLQKKESDSPEFSQLFTNIQDLSYESILNNFDIVKTRFEFNKRLNNKKKGNQHILFEIDNSYYLVNTTSWIRINSKDDLISLDDDQVIPASKLNGLLERKAITGMTPIENEDALFAIYTTPENIYTKRKNGAQPFAEHLTPIKPQNTVKEIIININKNGKLLVQSDLVELGDLKNYLSKINTHLSFHERKKIIKSIIRVDLRAPKNVIEEVDKILTEYGSATINIVGVESSFSKNAQQSATREQMAEYQKLAKKYNAMSKNNFHVKYKEVERLKYIYNLMSNKQKKDAEPFPEFPEPPPPPSAPSAINAINADVKNIPPPPYPVPKNREKYSKALLKALDTYVEEAENYGKASTDYRKNGKGTVKNLTKMHDEVLKHYDNFAELAAMEGLLKPQKPLAPKALKTPKSIKAPKVKKGKKNDIPPPPAPNLDEMAFADKVIDEIIANQDPYDFGRQLPFTSNGKMVNISPVYSSFFQKTLRENNKEINEKPPTPPAPVSPLEHVKSMAKKDALFYYKGKEISSDKAIELLKSNDKINIDTRGSTSKRPLILLSTAPIRIEN